MAKTLPEPTTTIVERGDGIEIHWTHQYDANMAHKPFRCVCASIECTRPTSKRMTKYLRSDER